MWLNEVLTWRSLTVFAWYLGPERRNLVITSPVPLFTLLSSSSLLSPLSSLWNYLRVRNIKSYHHFKIVSFQCMYLLFLSMTYVISKDIQYNPECKWWEQTSLFPTKGEDVACIFYHRLESKEKPFCACFSLSVANYLSQYVVTL